ncbi:hypothetical protein AAFF_G00368910 [Aldrovandia affinis]|uniref:Uncharacterized protein n=1 Tax=Aldrovandia affinis TaxID=143900 RepID=A0AAD7WMJ7_9TELE|nr:hypothetical protein AAFF_G00368910 [Aldrovandia affinis]
MCRRPHGNALRLSSWEFRAGLHAWPGGEEDTEITEAELLFTQVQRAETREDHSVGGYRNLTDAQQSGPTCDGLCTRTQCSGLVMEGWPKSRLARECNRAEGQVEPDGRGKSV